MADFDKRVVNVVLLGFGSANTELLKLIRDNNASRKDCRTGQNLVINVTGIFTRRHGGIAAVSSSFGETLSGENEGAISLSDALSPEALEDLSTLNPALSSNDPEPDGGSASASGVQFLTYDTNTLAGTEIILGYLEKLRAANRIDVLVEGIVANYRDGEPAVGFARWALGQGISYCTANKAPVALFYRELTELGRGRIFGSWGWEFGKGFIESLHQQSHDPY